MVESRRFAREEQSEPYEVTATPGWPPVAIPGRPGWYRHWVDGRQVDLFQDRLPG